MDRVISTDPRSWKVLSNSATRKPRKSDRVPLWVRGCYIALSDDVFAYLRRPRYVQILMQDEQVAIMPCGADDESARIVHAPKSPRMFYHILIFRMPSSIRQCDYHNLRFRQVAGEPYVAFDGST